MATFVQAAAVVFPARRDSILPHLRPRFLHQSAKVVRATSWRAVKMSLYFGMP